jgi:hypothetical protein
MSKIYKYDDMEKLSQKIKKLKKKKYLEEIRDIIITNNPKLNITENSYGIYLCFNELTNDTFIKLEKYVKKCLEVEEVKKNNSDFNFINSFQSDKNDEKKPTNNFFDTNSRLKFSNKEKNLLKKRLYDKALKINSEINDCEKNYLNSITLSTTSDTIDKIDKIDKINTVDKIYTSDMIDTTDTTDTNNTAEIIKEDQNLKIFLKKNKKS